MKEKILSNKNQQGFSLVELVVSMVIFLIVTGSIYGLLEVGRSDRDRTSQKSDVAKNARAAIHLLGRDALNAGYGYHKFGALVPDNVLADRLGITPDVGTDSDILTSVIVGNDSTPVGDGANITDTDSIAFASRDFNFNNGNPLTITDATSSNSMLILKGVSAAQVANVRVHDLFIAEAATTQVAVMVTAVAGDQITFAVGDPLGINQSYSISILKKCDQFTIAIDCVDYKVPVVLKKFFWVSYKVKPNGTLSRFMYGNNTGASASQQIIEQPLLYGIKNLQFTYTLSDGKVTSDPSAGDDNIFGTADDITDNLNKISLLNVSLTVQSVDSEAGSETAEKITINSSFSTRNLEYNRRKK
jgi:prepilin-type N-terminal cleavage/methylation domain-containing protein